MHTVAKGAQISPDLPPLAVEAVGIVHSMGDQDAMRRVWAQQPRPAYVPAGTAPDCSPLQALFPKNALRRLPRYAQMGLLAAHTALSAAQEHFDVDKEHTALVVASAHTCVNMSFDFMDSILDFGPHLSSPTAFSHAVNNMGAGLISLLMGLRGPCTTVTQFELSFAGAVQTAATLLHTHRVARVLVGVVEELDTRWASVTPAKPAMPVTPAAQPPTAEGAIFYSLSLQSDAPYSLSVPCWGSAFPAIDPAMDGQALFVSGAAQAPQAQNLRAMYGESPLAHALDCFFMGEALATSPHKHGMCVCADSITQRHATIHIRKSVCKHGH